MQLSAARAISCETFFYDKISRGEIVPRKYSAYYHSYERGECRTVAGGLRYENFLQIRRNAWNGAVQQSAAIPLIYGRTTVYNQRVARGAPCLLPAVNEVLNSKLLFGFIVHS